jgi:hypothetical protein
MYTFEALRTAILWLLKTTHSTFMKELHMAKALDGLALQTYFRRLDFRKEAQAILVNIRSSPPSRSPESRHGNVAVWYPSPKNDCVIKAESGKGEFAFVLEAEHDDEVLEFYDQPPSFPLEYRDKRNHLQRPLHTCIGHFEA